MKDAQGTSARVVVVGAGVVGCAVFRRLALAGLKPLMLERGADILSGASKANSALFHTLYEATGSSLELSCVRAGYREYMEIHERMNLPLLKTSAMVVAWTDEELARLPAVVQDAHLSGVLDVRQMGAAEALLREPNLAPDVKGAVLVPGEYVIDPWSAPLAYALQGIANGGEVRRNCEVRDGAFEDGIWRLQTNCGSVEASAVINCAGLFGDLVEGICRESHFTIKPRKGQFIVFDKAAAGLVNATILPLANKYTKGVLVGRTVFGNLVLGPTAEEQEDRETAAVDGDVLKKILALGLRMVPALAKYDITATYAGLRPATQFSDYQIEALPERKWITVAGIRSSGLTGSLGIATYVAQLYAEHIGPLDPIEDPLWVTVPNLSEYRARPYQEDGCGEIVCHCERVTRGEIEAALEGPLPARDLPGLKRRTRCMMGRCQGFFCSSRIAELSAKSFPRPLSSGQAA